MSRHSCHLDKFSYLAGYFLISTLSILIDLYYSIVILVLYLYPLERVDLLTFNTIMGGLLIILALLLMLNLVMMIVDMMVDTVVTALLSEYSLT